MKDNTIEIFVNEEYGYKAWIWRPNMTEDEFISWWSSLTETDIIKYFFNIRSVPGILTPYKRKDLSLTSTGENVRMAGDPMSHKPYYYCHMHDVDDTFMCIGDNKYPFRRTTRRDWKENWIDWTLKSDKPVSL
jgi:hypothetical protein